MFDLQIATVFSGGILRKILNNQNISLAEYAMVVGFLVQQNIPYDTSFQPGTRKAAAALQLTIHINPSATLVLVVALEPGSTAFSPSP
jgi:hypothetical protein